jgi:hypothetical protein
MMDSQTLVSYLQANSIPVISVDEHEDQTAIRINQRLTVLHQDGIAQVVIHSDPPRFCPAERTYLGVVAAVREHLPKRERVQKTWDM